MTTLRTLTECTAADMLVRYTLQESTGRVSLIVLPERMAGHEVARRASVEDRPEIRGLSADFGNLPAWRPDPLVHLKLAGSPCADCFGQGRTMREARDTDSLRLVGQRRDAFGAGGWRIVTTMRHPSGALVEHHLEWDGGLPALKVWTVFINDSEQTLWLEMLTSFSLGGITPFARDDAPGRLYAHRFRSAWSAEGFLETVSMEELHLLPSWQSTAIRCERFGQVGSFPVNGFHPWAAVEDRGAGVLWGAYLCWAGSWQMELFRSCDTLAVSGGLADREFGHWMKHLEPGQSFETPAAWLSCCCGSVDDICDRLRAPLDTAAERNAPGPEKELPVVFNDWCTYWGTPSTKRIESLADRLAGTPVRYFVIDAGWYRPDVRKLWFASHGDWVPNTELFPDGLHAASEAIRSRGMIPGLWFEYETVGNESHASRFSGDWFLCRDGAPIEVPPRKFWDLRQPAVLEYLRERVIARLKEDGFGYVKIDYNASIGIGCDHPDSLGEGLRAQIVAVHSFLDEMRAALPGLVIENCASGGHRLEPSLLEKHAMASFSDAHECLEIPVIAANLQRLVPPRQCQIWAVLREGDDEKRLRYSLASTFLGRMCLSGDVDRLDAAQWSLVRDAMDFYGHIWPVIARGCSRRQGAPVASHRHLTGGQTVLRVADGGATALVVAHSFAGGIYRDTVPLGKDEWIIERRFGLPEARLAPRGLLLSLGPLDAGALLLRRRRPDRGKSRRCKSMRGGQVTPRR